MIESRVGPGLGLAGRFYRQAVRPLLAGAPHAAGAVTNPDLRAVLDRLGARGGGASVGSPGAIDQAIDSVDVLTNPRRCRAAAALLGLADR